MRNIAMFCQGYVGCWILLEIRYYVLRFISAWMFLIFPVFASLRLVINLKIDWFLFSIYSFAAATWQWDYVNSAQLLYYFVITVLFFLRVTTRSYHKCSYRLRIFLPQSDEGARVGFVKRTHASTPQDPRVSKLCLVFELNASDPQLQNSPDWRNSA